MDPLKPSPREVIDRQIEQCIETGNRQELASILDDEVVIKRLETARYAEAITRKALDVLCAAIASERISNQMLLRIVVTLSKLNSTFLTELGRVDGFDRDDAECQSYEGSVVLRGLLPSECDAFEALEFVEALLLSPRLVEYFRKECRPTDRV
jgi:hypothetical protein